QRADRIRAIWLDVPWQRRTGRHRVAPPVHRAVARPGPRVPRMTAVFTGVGVALVTLFTDRGDLDASATAALAAQLVDLGVQAVVVAGSTGEAASLDAGERAVLLAVVRSEIAGRVPIIAGTGAPSARQAAAL